MIRRDRKGRFSYEGNPVISAERGLLSHVRAILFTFGSDVSEGSATKHGTALSLRSNQSNLSNTLRAALAPAIPPGRTLEIRSHEQPHLRGWCYLIHVLPPAPTVAVGGPRSQEASV